MSRTRIITIESAYDAAKHGVTESLIDKFGHSIMPGTTVAYYSGGYVSLGEIVAVDVTDKHIPLHWRRHYTSNRNFRTAYIQTLVGEDRIDKIHQWNCLVAVREVEEDAARQGQ